MSSARYWKFLNVDGTPCHGGSGRWTVGVWRSVSGELVPCENGIHACREGDLSSWIGPALHPIALAGEIRTVSDKVVARAGCVGPRLEGWDECAMRLFAADCAANVRHLNTDFRVVAAIVIARGRAFGLCDAAARAAAEAAAEAAARAAAGAAARAAAWDAAWAAARAAAGAAAGAAARAAAEAAARVWQSRRILAYACGGIDLDLCRQQTEAALPEALRVVGIK